LHVTETSTGVLVQFVDKKILNDHKMELMAEELHRVADKLGPRELRLDFDRVVYVQSSVLGKLVSLHKKVTAGGGRLILCNIHTEAYKVFTVTKLDNLFIIERKEEDEAEMEEPRP
jgi:anti-sigma B factor antagonist